MMMQHPQKPHTPGNPTLARVAFGGSGSTPVPRLPLELLPQSASLQPQPFYPSLSSTHNSSLTDSLSYQLPGSSQLNQSYGTSRGPDDEATLRVELPACSARQCDSSGRPKPNCSAVAGVSRTLGQRPPRLNSCCCCIPLEASIKIICLLMMITGAILVVLRFSVLDIVVAVLILVVATGVIWSAWTREPKFLRRAVLALSAAWVIAIGLMMTSSITTDWDYVCQRHDKPSNNCASSLRSFHWVMTIIGAVVWLYFLMVVDSYARWIRVLKVTGTLHGIQRQHPTVNTNTQQAAFHQPHQYGQHPQVMSPNHGSNAPHQGVRHPFGDALGDGRSPSSGPFAHAQVLQYSVPIGSNPTFAAARYPTTNEMYPPIPPYHDQQQHPYTHAYGTQPQTTAVVHHPLFGPVPAQHARLLEQNQKRLLALSSSVSSYPSTESMDRGSCESRYADAGSSVHSAMDQHPTIASSCTVELVEDEPLEEQKQSLPPSSLVLKPRPVDDPSQSPHSNKAQGSFSRGVAAPPMSASQVGVELHHQSSPISFYGQSKLPPISQAAPHAE